MSSVNHEMKTIDFVCQINQNKSLGHTIKSDRFWCLLKYSYYVLLKVKITEIVRIIGKIILEF